MPIDSLLAAARRSWEELAGVPVPFPPSGGVNVAVSPESGMCPAGWVGVAALGGSVIVTAPNGSVAAIVRDSLRKLPAQAVVDADSVHMVLPVSRVLGPAVLAYLSPERFRSVHPGASEDLRLPTARVGAPPEWAITVCSSTALAAWVSRPG